MEETLKPVRGNRSNNRNSGIFQDFRQQAEAMAQTPPRSNSIPMALNDRVPGTPEFMNMRNISAEFKKIEQAFDSMAGGPLEMPSFTMPNLGLPKPFDYKPSLQPPLEFESQMTSMSSDRASPGSQTPSRRSSPHRRTDSVASFTSAASIADINIEETKTETGVTLEEIAAFIQGPDPATGKWVCLYENCNKPFGRKENIKSHVQTHLNDRQYQCPTCHKCFVRQHDLKRHAKIHTGIKPYPCQCGQSFARHDALTRHRQRGMCIGAYDGVVRKVAKRGRPKKVRPDMDERRDKAERTRRKNKLTSAGSASSQSGYSDSSAANSPHNDFDGLLDDDPFPGIAETALLSSLPSTGPITMDPTELGVSSAPMPTTISGSLAEALTAMSPSATSDYSQHSTLSLVASPALSHANLNLPHLAPAIRLPDYHHRPPSPAKSPASLRYTPAPGTPPALSATSSPPPTTTTSSSSSSSTSSSHSARFHFDLAPPEPGNSSILSDTSIGLGTTVAAHAAADAVTDSATALSGGVGVGVGGSLLGLDDDLFLQFAAADEHGLVTLDPIHLHHAGLMVGGGKFEKLGGEEEFDPVSMFTNGDDLYFGAV